MRIRQYRHVLAACAVVALSATAAYAASFSIDQVGSRFSEHTLNLKIGDVVKFLNHDDVRHNIGLVDSDGNRRDLGFQELNQEIDLKVDQSGRFMVRCSIHPKMKMLLFVQ
jgi:plastocyanin